VRGGDEVVVAEDVFDSALGGRVISGALRRVVVAVGDEAADPEFGAASRILLSEVAI